MTSALRLDGYTLEDWDDLEPTEGRRVELVGGRFRVNAAPIPRHQRVSDRLRTMLASVVEPLGLEVLTAIGVRLQHDLGYIPDVVVCEPPSEEVASISASSVALVVEVGSPSTHRVDLLEKPTAYAAAGIPAYWRIELPRHKPATLFCYVLDQGVYVQTHVVEAHQPAKVTLPLGASVTVDVAQLDWHPWLLKREVD